MRMGIGIGWPNASASNQSQMVYFAIEAICFGIVPSNSTTQLVDSSIYQTGDLVDFDNGNGNNGRVILGEIVENPGDEIFNIYGPVYTSCST
jgi:hypothetical protein